MRTSSIISLFAVLIIVTVALTYNSCKKDKEEEPPPPPDNEIIIAANAKIVDSTQLTNLQITGTTYTYDITGGTPTFGVGDIISGAAYGGYLRKVISANVNSGKLVVETEDAKLVDAVENGDFQQNTTITFLSKSGTPQLNEFVLVNAAKGVHVNGNLIDLDGVVLYEGQIGGVDVKLSFPEGSVGITPGFDFGLKIRNKKVKELHCFAEGPLVMDFTAKLEANGDFSTQKEKNLVTFQSYLVQLIGPWPVYEVITLSFDAGFSSENNINGEITTGFNSTYQMKYGYEYTSDNGWAQVWEKTPTFTQYPAQGLFNADLNLEVYIKPSLTIEFYGVVGPGIDVRPYLNFDLSAHNKNIYWNWDLTGGVDGNLLFNAHIFDWQLINYSKNLINWNTLVASDNGVISVGNTPIVPTNSVTSITETTATCGGNVTDRGSSSVTARGVCWSTSSNPTTSNSHTTNGSGTGSFTSNIKELTANTPYYVRAYATNSAGTAYGNQVSFTTSGGGLSDEPCPGIPTITDTRDGQVYPTVQIGNQCWLQKNMNYETGNSLCYENDPANCAVYGRLYDWETALNVCPSGWHLPSDEEWKILEGKVDTHYGVGDPEWDDTGWRGIDAGKHLKSTTGWYSNGNGDNSSGFTALPGGYRLGDGYFNAITMTATFWSSTETSSTNAWRRSLYDYDDDVRRDYLNKANGFSARCLQD